MAVVPVRSEDDVEAFLGLVERHSRGLYRLAYRITGSAQDAQDVLQESLFRAYRQLGQFEKRADLGTWLRRIVIKNGQFPASEDYFYKPLNEHVPVYQRPFRITQELMVDPSPAGQKALQGATRITVEGTLEYQACSDQECFPPQRLPLTWSVNIGPLDDTRIIAEASRPLPV